MWITWENITLRSFLDTLEDFRSFLPVCMILIKEDSHMYRCITHSWFKVLVIPWFKV